MIGRRAFVANTILAGFLGGAFDRAKVGKPAPPFTLTLLDGRRVSLAELAGKVVLLNFWATWCAPCRVELPLLDAYMRLHPRSDLKLFAVATEVTISDSDMRLIAYGLSFPFAARISSGAYGPLDGVPTNYVIDRGGVVRYAKAEPFDVASLDDVLSPLLAEPTPAQPAARS